MRGGSSSAIVRLLSLGFLLASMFAFRPPPRTEMLGNNVRLYVFIVLLALVIHFLSAKSRNWLNTENFFVLGLLVVGVQWPTMVALAGEDVLAGSPIEVLKSYFVFASWLASVGVISALMGMEVTGLWKNSAVLRSDVGVPRRSGYEFYMGSAVLFFGLFFLTVGSEFLSGTYRGATNWGAASRYFYLAFHASLLLATYEVISRLRLRSAASHFGSLRAIPSSYCALSILYVLSFWMLGDRGGPLSLLICFIALYVQSVRRVSFGHALALVVAGALVMAVIREGRNNEDGVNPLIAGYQNVSIERAGDFTAELATSFRTVQASSQVVDTLGDHYFGLSMVPDLLAVLPFGGTLVRQISGGEFAVPSTSVLMTLWINGPNSESGAGSSVFADSYLNFGVVGVVLVCIAYGYLIRKASNKPAVGTDMARTALVLTLASLSLYISRDSVFGPLKLFTWLVVIQVIYTVIGKRRFTRRSTPQ